MNSNKNILSIIVPVYNGEKHIDTTLKSLIFLNKKIDFELIFQDSCSEDKTAKIIKKHLKFFKNAKLFIEKDSGQSNGINRGVAKSSGIFVTWLCADDIFLPKFEKVFNILKSDKYDVVYGDCILLTRKVLSPAIGTEHYSKDKLLKKRLFIQQPGTCIRKIKWIKAGCLNEKLNWIMDYDLFIRLSLLKCRFFRLNEFISVARIYPEAKSSSGSFLRLFEYLRMFSHYHINNLYYFSFIPYLVYSVEYLIKTLESKRFNEKILRILHKVFWKIAKPTEIESISLRFNKDKKHILKILRTYE